jgi:hypothetical protein
MGGTTAITDRSRIEIRSGGRAAQAGQHRRRWSLVFELLALAALIALAAALRFPALSVAPPALWVDESFNGLDILRIFDGYREPFFPANYGREGLFIYAQALSVLFFGPTPAALRLVSAAVGTATVAATWALARAWFGRWVGLLSAGVIATLVWHITFSRIGLRTICAPLALAIVLWLFWRTLIHGRLSDAILTGAALGLALQTYLSTRILPPLLLVFFLLEWRFNPSLLRARWKALIWASVVAALVFSPLGYYYFRHPDAAFRRSDMVLGLDVPHDEFFAVAFLRSLLRMLAIFNVQGDLNWRHNVSGRPVFDFTSGLLFLLGTGIAARRILEEEYVGSATRGGSPALHPYLWWFVALAATLLPFALTPDGPHFLRMTIILPLAAMAPAIGARQLWLFLEGTYSRLTGSRPSGSRLAIAAALAGVAMVLGLTWVGYETYWGVWAVAPETRNAYSADEYDLGLAVQRYLAGANGRSVIQGCRLPCDDLPTVEFMLPRGVPSRGYDLGSTVYPLFAFGGADQVHLEAASDRLPAPDLPETYFGSAVQQRFLSPDRPALGLKIVPGWAIAESLARMRPMSVDFGDLELIGSRTPDAAAVPAGGPVIVDLEWRVKQGGPKNFGPIVRLRDGSGMVWATDVGQGIAVGGWRAGDLFLSRHVLAPPADSPPGTYQIEATAALRSLDPNSAEIIETPRRPVALGGLAVGLPQSQAAPPSPLGPADGRTLTPGVVLAEVAPRPETARPGEDYAFDVRWQLAGGLPELEVQLLQDDRIVAVTSTPPLDGPARQLRQRYKLSVPRALAPGRAEMRILTRSAGDAVSTLNLGELRVEAPERRLAPRPMQNAGSAQFGEALRLTGWDLDVRCEGARRDLALSIQWQAVGEMAVSYTAFVQVLDAGGAIAAQADRLPRQGSYLTTSWLTGEYVIERYDLYATSTAPLRLIAGWYDARSGARLPLLSGPAAGPDAALLAEGLPSC